LLRDGYLPEAITNYIALLGWCPKNSDTEFFTLEELKKVFTIDGVSKSPAIFDFEKLLWFNGEYIHRLSPEDFKSLVTPFIKTNIPDSINKDKMLELLRTRISKLSEADEKMAFFINLPKYEKELFLNKKNKISDFETVKTILTAAYSTLEKIDSFDNDTLFAALTPLTESLGMKTGAIMWCIRIAVSGLSSTPGGATEIMEVIGKTESLSRIKSAIDLL
jgi:glutamyl-tRNA synthetase